MGCRSLCQNIKGFKKAGGEIPERTNENCNSRSQIPANVLSDVIMLNLITNKLLKSADPQTIEKILSPVDDKERRDDG